MTSLYRMTWRNVPPLLLGAFFILGGISIPAQAANYGNLYGSTTAANQGQVLDSATKKISMRFTAKTNKTVNKLRVYVSAKAGTSPIYTVGLQSDDGTANSLPNGYISGNNVNTALAQFWNTIDIGNTAITAGTVYHLVIEYSSGTIDGSNNVSIGTTSPNFSLYPSDGSSDTKSRALYDGAGDGFANDTADALNPVYLVEFDDATYEGNPIVQMDPNTPVRDIYSTQKVGQTFTVSGSDRYVTDISMILSAPFGTDGESSLTVFLEDVTGGTVIESGTIADSSLGTSFTSKTYTFNKVRRLQNGRQYRIYLSSNTEVDYSFRILHFSTRSTNSEYANLTFNGTISVMQYNQNDSGWTSALTNHSDCYFNFTISNLLRFDLDFFTPQSNNAVFTGTVQITAIRDDGNALTTFDAAKNNVTITVNTGGAVSGLSGGNKLTLLADFTSGVASVNAGSLKLSYTGSSGSVIFTATSEDLKTGTDTVTINPGALYQFSVNFTSPQTNNTGFTGTNTVTAQDISSNTITNFDASATNVAITTTSSPYLISGLGTGANHILNKNTDFSSGIANLTSLLMTYSGVTGAYVFTATGNSKSGASGSITINPGALTYLTLAVASPQTNGVTFTATNAVTLYDTSGNVITNFDASANKITLTVTGPTGSAGISGLGSGNNNVIDRLGDTSNGAANLATLNMKYTGVSGTYNFDARSGGKTSNVVSNVTINPGALDHFGLDVSTPQTNAAAWAGTVKITAFDAQNNIKTDFNASGNLVTPTVGTTGIFSGLSGGNKLNNAADFSNGIANLVNTIVYTGPAGTITVTMTSADGKMGTASVVINHGSLDHFDIALTSPQVVAVAFNGVNTVTARDVSGNPVLNFNAATDNVTFTSSANAAYTVSGLSGSNQLNNAADFTNGVASVSAMKFAGPTGTWTFSPTSGTGKTGTSNGVTFTTGVLHHLHLAVNTPQKNGAVFTSAVLTLHDEGHNVVTTNPPQATLTVVENPSPHTLIVGPGRSNILDSPNTDFTNGVADLAGKLIYTGLAGTYTFQAAGGGKTTTQANVVINPGDIHHFHWDTAATQLDGAEWTTTRLTAHDVSHNVKSDFDASGNPVTINANSPNYNLSGLGSSDTNALNQNTDFASGVAVLGTGQPNNLKYTGLIGTYQFSATAQSSSTITGNASVQILLGPLNHFRMFKSGSLNTPWDSPQRNAKAFTGTPVLGVFDAGDNPITTYNANSSPVSLTSDSPTGNAAISGLGSSNNNILNRSSDFSNGYVTLGSGQTNALKYTGQLGTFVFNVGGGGKTALTPVTLQILPGDIHHFHLNMASPQGDGVTFGGLNTITAHDEAHEIKTDFDAGSSPVTVAFNSASYSLIGLGTNNNSVLNRDFVNGIASLGSGTNNTLTYVGTIGSYTVTASCSGGVTGTAMGTFSSVTITLGDFDHFKLTLSSPQKNAMTFSLVNGVTAMDIGNNPITTFGLYTTLSQNRAGGTLALTNAFSGSVLRPEDFTNGSATLTDNMVFSGPVGTVTITFRASNGKSSTATIVIESGDLDHFDLTLTSADIQIEGTAWTGAARLIAKDSANVTINTFNAANNPVTVTFSNTTYPGATGTLTGLTGGNQLSLSTDFTSGIATLTGQLIYTGTPGVLRITAISADQKTGTATVTLYQTPLVTDFSVGQGFVHTLSVINLTGVGFFGVTLVGLDDTDGTRITGFTVSSHNVITSVTLTAGISSGRYNVQAFNYAGTTPTSTLAFDILIGMDDPESRVVKSANGIDIHVPPAAFDNDAVVIATPNTSMPAALSAAAGKITALSRLTLLTALEYTVREITAVGGNLKSGVKATLVFPYTGITDTQIENNLVVLYLNPTKQEWELADGTQTIDKTGKKISLATTHFSIYRVAAQLSTAADFKSLAVFPNPVNFSKAVRGTLKFDKLTALPTIRIYTVSGELVRSIAPGTSTNDGTTGKAEWDGKNEQGESVAQGLYFFLLTDPQNNKVSGKVVVVK